MKFMNQLRRFGASSVGKVSAGASSLMASGAAFASGGGTPGSAIAGEISGGKADVALVVSAIAIILGFIIVWRYVKKAG